MINFREYKAKKKIWGVKKILNFLKVMHASLSRTALGPHILQIMQSKPKWTSILK